MSTDALAEELKLVEEDLTRLRETAAGLRRRIGDRDDEPTDAAERSALIEAAEEQEALIDQLEARREELLRRARPAGQDQWELTVKVIVYGSSTACTATWPANALTGWSGRGRRTSNGAPWSTGRGSR
ncbi:MAG TPA: hypothetical protein VK594_05410 [Streptosporangiaceae bacterium]|nr:hypothetical protein [Streptosporangiaceae bacterium]